MIRLKLTYFTILLGLAIGLVTITHQAKAQDVPQKTEVPKPPKKKRIKKKFKGDQARSNKRQIRRTKFKTRNKQGDRAVGGDITGRKFKSRRTPRKTIARPQPDPYAGRRPKDRQVDRAGPDPPLTFREPPKGERARTGDITGKRRIRTRSASSARASTYPRRDPYAGREQRSAERAQRIRRAQVAGSRTATRTAERKRTIAASRPKTVSGIARIRSSKNPYAGKGRRKGETATTKDIAGRKLRTRNTDSAPRIPKGGYAPTDTYYGRKKRGEGGRFSRGAMLQGQSPSISRSGEERGRAYREPALKNYQSPRPKTSGPSFDPYAGRKKIGEGGRFKDRRKPKVRTASRKGERSVQARGVVPKSISGIRKIRKTKDPYAGRQRRFGERASNKDIAGRKLRTKGFESPKPQWRESLQKPDTYYGRKDVGDRTSRARIPSQGGRSISGRVWNNRGVPIGAKPPGAATQQATQFRGRFRPFDLQPGYADDRAISKYQGRFRWFELQPGYGDERGMARYQGNIRRGGKPLKGGGSISGGIWNNRGVPIGAKPPSAATQQATQFRGRFRPFDLQPGYADDRAISKYQGRFRPFELQPGYADDRAIGKYQGRFKPFELQPGYADDRGMARYQGNIRGGKPLKGGGSISGGIWNNRGVPIGAKPPSAATQQATQFRGRFRPFDLQPGYADDRAIGKYQGRFKPFELQPGYADDRGMARYQGNIIGGKPLKGGGSISGGIWNNRGLPIGAKPPSAATQQATQFRGRFRPFDLQPGYADDRAIGKYQGRFKPFELQPGYADDRGMARFQGNIKSGKPLKGGGSISGRLWNNKETPIGAKPPSASTQQATQFRGRFRPFDLQPGYADDRAIGKYQGRFKPFELQPGYSDDRGMARFQGNIKSGKPLKGGGSISGGLWNNKETPIGAKPPSSATQQATQFRGRFTPFELSPGYYDDRRVARYQGNMKAAKPLKGGGSISGKSFNNDGNPLARQSPLKDDRSFHFQGNLKAQKPLKGVGGSVSGEIWNNKEQPLAKKFGPAKGSQFQGKFNAGQFEKPDQSQGSEYGQSRKFFFLSSGDNTRESTSLSKNRKPTDTNYGKVQSLFFITPAKAKNYKGYVSKEPELFDFFTSRKQMHPSYNYSQGEHVNAKEEKEKIFKLKIWWGQIFGINDNQPKNLKSREKKPRYDKRESELWYE